MTVDISVDKVFEEDDLFTKITYMRVGSDKKFPVLPSINLAQGVKSVTLKNLKTTVIVENYIKLELSELRKMNEDGEKQKQFIRDEIKISEENPSFIVIKLLIKDNDQINDNDIKYLCALLMHPHNTLVIPPLVYYYKLSNKNRVSIQNPLELDKYIKFTSNFLKRLTENYKVTETALTIPTNISNDKIKALTDEYKNIKTQIAFIDLHGGTAMDIYTQLNSMIKTPSKKEELYNLEQKNGENYLLYGFDSKPYGSPKDIAPAKNVLQYTYGISAFGPRYTLPKMKFPKGPRKPYIPRVYYEEEYAFVKPHYADYKKITKGVDDWVSTVLPDAKDASTNRTYMLNYNVNMIIDSAKEIYQNAEEKNLGKFLGKKKAIEKYVSQIKRFNHKFNV